MSLGFRSALLLVVLGLSGACTSNEGADGSGGGGSSGSGASGSGASGGGAGITGSGGWAGTGASGATGGGAGAGGTGAVAGTGTGGSAPTELDLHDATIWDNPPDEVDWPITTKITALDFNFTAPDGNCCVHVEFSKQDGADRWPDITPPGWSGPLQYTLGMAEFIDGKWHASAAIQYWYGLGSYGGNVAVDNQVAKNWYYAADRWGPMAGRQPATGETIGIFVIAGNVRAVKDGSQSPVKERSNVVLVPMPDVNGGKYTF